MISKMPFLNKKLWLNAIIVFSLLFIWILFLFQEAFLGMVSIWSRSETFTHGFLVPPIVAWLIWRKRDEILCLQPKANFLLLVPIVIVSSIWLLGDLVSINSVTQLSATALLVLLVFAVFGWSVASVILFPLLFLFFSVPLGEFLLPLLMDWTAKFTVIAIRLSGVPVYQEGLQFVISSGNWSVVEACSGVRYLISSLMIGTLYAYLNYQSLNRRIIFVCVSIIVPILANWMRAYFIVMLGHLSNNKLAVGFDHLIYGWLFFGLVIMLMFLIGGRWAESAVINKKPPIVTLTGTKTRASGFWYIALVTSIFVTFPVGWVKFISVSNTFKSPVLVAPNVLGSEWMKSVDSVLDVKPNFHGPSIDLNTTYVKNSSNIGLYIKYYRNQNYDNKLVNSENYIFDPKDKSWLSVGSENYVVNGINDGLIARVTNWRGMGLPGQKSVVHLQTWQVYWVNGLFTESDYKAKIYGSVQRLLGRGDDSAIIVLYAIDEAEGPAKKLIEEFLQDNYSEVKLILEKARSDK